MQGKIDRHEIDHRLIRALGDLRESDAQEALERFSSSVDSSIRSRQGFLMGIIKRFQRDSGGGGRRLDSYGGPRRREHHGSSRNYDRYDRDDRYGRDRHDRGRDRYNRRDYGRSFDRDRRY